MFCWFPFDVCSSQSSCKRGLWSFTETGRKQNFAFFVFIFIWLCFVFQFFIPNWLFAPVSPNVSIFYKCTCNLLHLYVFMWHFSFKCALTTGSYSHLAHFKLTILQHQCSQLKYDHTVNFYWCLSKWSVLLCLCFIPFVLFLDADVCILCGSYHAAWPSGGLDVDLSHLLTEPD